MQRKPMIGDITLLHSLEQLFDRMSPEEKLHYIRDWVDNRARKEKGKALAASLLGARAMLLYEPKAIAIDSLQELKDNYGRGRIFWIMWNLHDMPECYPVFYTGFGTVHEAIEGTRETVNFIDGFDFADGLGVDYVLWTHKPTDKQKKEYKWKENS